MTRDERIKPKQICDRVMSTISKEVSITGSTKRYPYYKEPSDGGA